MFQVGSEEVNEILFIDLGVCLKVELLEAAPEGLHGQGTNMGLCLRVGQGPPRSMRDLPPLAPLFCHPISHTPQPSC